MEDGFKNSKILVAGLGLIGGSAAKSLKNAGFPVYAYDLSGDTLARAFAEGVIVKGYSNVSDIPEMDMMLCCLPPGAAAPFLREARVHLKNGGVFAETGGLKEGITHELASILEGSRELLSLHPMAGKEKSGYEHSEAGLFKGCVMILTPTEKTGLAALIWAKELAQAFKCSDIFELPADKHDKVIARVSHLPHMLALALRSMDEDGYYKMFAGGSYRSATRVADINPKLWAELFTKNKKNLLLSLSVFKESLGKLEEALSDPAKLEKLLGEIANYRGE